MDSIEDIKKKIIPILKQYPVVKAGLFGDFIDGEVTKDGDLDVLVEFEEGEAAKLGWAYFGLIGKLERALGRQVDMGQYKLIKPRFKKLILSQEIRIYEKKNGR